MTGIAQLDARHLLCPLPVIRTQERIGQLPPGARLEVVATDPGVLHDIPAWCRVHGHSVAKIWHHERDIHLLLQVGEPDRTKTVHK